MASEHETTLRTVAKNSNGTDSMTGEKDSEFGQNVFNDCETNVKQFWLSHIFAPVIYCLIFVIGVIGNGLVVWLMVKKNNSGHAGYQRSVTNIYVLNLAIADLIFVGFLPFWTAASISEK